MRRRRTAAQPDVATMSVGRAGLRDERMGHPLAVMVPERQRLRVDAQVPVDGYRQIGGAQVERAATSPALPA